jgi:hypothetical protein
MRGFRHAFLVCLLSLLTLSAAPRAHAQQTVVLGNSTAELTGPWKFHIGDNMAWAQPGFDDSGWGTMDLTPPPGSYDPHYGFSGYVPGWTARGYRGYSGYGWYRMRVNIQNVQDSSAWLDIKIPPDIDDACQLYINGKFAGEYGEFTGRRVTTYRWQPRAFRLPAAIGNGSATIAIRMWMDHDTPLFDPDAGGLHAPPVLGHPDAIRALLRLDWDEVDREQGSNFLEMVILLLALLLAFGLYGLDRSEPAFLWLGITCAAILFYTSLLTAGYYVTWIGEPFYLLFQDAVLIPVVIGIWVLFWGYWFRLERMARLHGIVWGLVLPLVVGMSMLRVPLYGNVVSIHAVVWLSPLTLILKLLLGALLAWVTYQGLRRDPTEGWLALPAVLLVAVSIYQEELLVMHVPVYFFASGFGMAVNQIATILSLGIITVLLSRRFLHGQREREQWKLEIEQARQVQQMLIPDALPVVPGFTLESEYRPAQQVGGDFFQIIAGEENSVLIVVGDVSGKGLKAAMLVSLIVGTIRTLAKFTCDPMEVLRGLNERLCGRMQGHFATCVVAHIAANGETALANAGHLAPYWNGKEVTIAGSLPLGIIEGAEFTRTEFRLGEKDRLTFMTDGVVEAQNEKKELFGFERAQQLADQPAATIAQSAQRFGQEDDITVVSVVRATAAAHAA